MISNGKYYLFNNQIRKFTPDSINHLTFSLNHHQGAELNWRASGSRLPFFSGQYQRVKDLESSLNLRISGWEDPHQVFEAITNAITQNRLFKGIMIHIGLLPVHPGEPLCDSFVWFSEWPDDEFILNQKGAVLLLDKSAKHPGKKELYLDQIQPFRKWHLANKARSEDGDYFILENTSGKMLECPGAHICLVKGDRVFTPSNPEITCWGIASEIKKIVGKWSLSLVESSSLQTAHLMQADEVFIVNDFDGIIWIMGFRDKRYFRKLSRRLTTEINLIWKES